MIQVKNWLAGVVLGIGALGLAPAAEAAVVYTFVQTGSTTPNVTASATIVLSDEAYATGGSYFINNSVRAYSLGGGGGPTFSYAGLLALDIRFLEGPGRLSQSFGLEDFLTPVPYLAPTAFDFYVNLTNQPSGGLSGTINLFDLYNDVTFSLGAAGGLAFYRTDAPSDCNNSFGCRFSGQVFTTTVPEPASLALFGAGLFGLGMVRRRRA